MIQRFILFLVIVLMIFCFISCEKTNKVAEFEGMKELDMIPSSYGTLVSVTTADQFPGWSQLWFSDSTGVVRMVRVNWEKNKMLEKVITILRSAETM